MLIVRLMFWNCGCKMTVNLRFSDGTNCLMHVLFINWESQTQSILLHCVHSPLIISHIKVYTCNMKPYLLIYSENEEAKYLPSDNTVGCNWVTASMFSEVWDQTGIFSSFVRVMTVCRQILHVAFVHMDQDNSGQTEWTATWNFQQCDMCDQQRLRPDCAYAQSGQSIC